MSKGKTAPREAFKIDLRPIAGGDGSRRAHLIAECRDCEREEAVAISTRTPQVPLDMARQLFRKRGWKIGSSRSKDYCPTCHGRDKRDSAPPEERASISIEAVITSVSNMLHPLQIVEVLEEEPEVANDPSPSNAQTAIGAALVGAAIEKSGLKKSGRGAPERLRAAQAKMTPEERSAATVKGHETRKARKQAEAAALRAKRGAGSKAYWDAMTPEERSQRQKDAAAVRLAKQAAAKLQPAEQVPAQVALGLSNVQNKINSETPMPAAAVKTLAPAVSAEPPRAATPPENRRIIEALDTHYDTAHQCYLGAMTDKALAEALNLPAAWIGKMRESVYGPERNQAADVAAKALREQWELLSKIETDFLAEMDKFDARMKASRREVQKAAESIGVKLG